MKVVSPDELYRTLQAGQRGGVYLVFGEEDYLQEEAVGALVSAHLDPATRDFNFDQLRAGETPPEQLAAVVATPPLMAEWRVVLVRDVQAFASSSRARAVLEQLVARKIPGLLLIMTAQIPGGRAQFYDTLRKLATPVQCSTLTDADLPGWLTARASTREIELEPEAALALAAAIGSDLGVLLQELNKLIEFVGERRRITKQDVQNAVGSIPRLSRWEWFDLVGDRNFSEARRALPALLDSGENGVGLTIGLGTQFLRIAIGAAGGQRTLEAALPPHQKWLVGRIVRQARGWPAPAADLALADLLRADRLLKSTSLSDLQVLEELLLRLQARTTAVAA